MSKVNEEILEKLKAMDKATELFHKTCMIYVVGQQQLALEIRQLIENKELEKVKTDGNTH